VTEADDTIEAFRTRIAAADRALVAAVNARIDLVAELKAYKEEHGISFLDPDRERELLRALQEANPGPLSDAGLRDLVEHVLALTKRELG
jgi:3-deoxy-7-phosphoheptulonate synthase / chorismate mutase